MDKTGMFIEKNGKLSEQQIDIDVVKEEYIKDSANVYPPKFFANMVKLRGWQNEVGQELARKFSFKSAIDFGCAQGYYLEGMHKENVDVFGFEHAYDNAKEFIPEALQDKVVRGDVQQKDLTDKKADFVMSVEVAEHLLPENSLQYVSNLCSCEPDLILFSAAGPNQNGLGHINTRPLSDWLDMFAKFGYSTSDSLTEDFRNVYRSLAVKSKYNRMLSRHVIGLGKNK